MRFKWFVILIPLLTIAMAVWQRSELVAAPTPADATAAPSAPGFGRHVLPILSKLGCNGGGCHGAVQGKNGFRLSLFGGKPEADYAQLAFGMSGRRVDRASPDDSLFLLKATRRVSHEGGRLIEKGSYEYNVLRQWVAAGMPRDEAAQYRATELRVTPLEQVIEPGKAYPLRVEAKFEDGSVEDVTRICSFTSRDQSVVKVSAGGVVTAVGVGDAALIVRYRDEPVAATVLVPRPAAPGETFPSVAAANFIDEQVLAKLKRLNIPPSGLADDETFLRRVSIDVTGALPTPDEVRAFVKDTAADKRARKVDELLVRPGHAALWTLKFCDLLKATDFGVYADALSNENDAPRFAAWVRARMEENTPYDQFVERILLATSREGKPVQEWAKDVEKLYELSTADWGEHKFYAQRQTLDLYWDRKGANGVSGTLQVAHAFLGLRLECAQCHRHPHDVWQQDDLLSFGNFFSKVRTPGFQGDNEKKYVEHAKVFKELEAEGKKLEAEAKKLKDGELKTLADQMKKAEAAKKTAPELYEKAKSAHDKMAEQVRQVERRGRLLKDDVAKRVLHTDIENEPKQATFAKVTSPLGTQESKQFRLLGSAEPVTIAPDQDPRKLVMDWMRRPDNPYFARAIVNRVWAHYMGRGIVDPPDNLSPLNPPSHPKLLDELAKQFIANRYDLRWLHRVILNSRTYQQSGAPSPANAVDRSNYAFFYFRRLPAEVLIDALDRVTGTREDFGMKFYRWPANLTAVEAPYTPTNPYITFMLEQFGKPKRNAAVQCDCERDPSPSVLQVMSLANHPRVLQKIADPTGRAAAIAKTGKDDDARIEELFLTVLGRSPVDAERAACRQYLKTAPASEKGVQGIMWSLVNTREFMLQH